MTAPLGMSDDTLAAALPATFPPSTRPPPPPPTDPELCAALDTVTLPAAFAAGDAGLFVAVEAVELCAAAADGDLGEVAGGGAAETQEGEDGEGTPLREALVVEGDGFVRVLEAATETRLRREDAAGLDAAGAPTRLEVPGMGRVAVVCGLEGFGVEELEGVGVEVAADVGERKAAAAASSFSRRIL